MLGPQNLATDMYVERSLQKEKAAPVASVVTTNVTIHGAVRVLQAGDGLVANVSSGFSQGDQTAILACLTQAGGAIVHRLRAQ